MVSLPVTLNDLKDYFCCLKPFWLPYLEKCSTYYLLYVYTWIEKRT